MTARGKMTKEQTEADHGANVRLAHDLAAHLIGRWMREVRQEEPLLVHGPVWARLSKIQRLHALNALEKLRQRHIVKAERRAGHAPKFHRH